MNSEYEFYHEEDRKDLADINIVPLVDVMLVLLIVFMISAPLSLSGIRVNLPVSRYVPMVSPDSKVVISINAKGDYYIDSVKIPNQHLISKLKAIFDHKEKKQLYVKADKDVSYYHVINAMNDAKLAGVSKISMITKRQN